MLNTEHFLWTEKYRPKTLDDIILTPELTKEFADLLAKGELPNLLLSGPQGCGKTTVAKALLEMLECDYIVINGSMKGNIDTLRTEILEFASTVSFVGGRKYVILDEADYLNANSTQPALRNFMEEFASNCGFILTCNNKSRIIGPLQSRCTVIDFKFPKSILPKLAAQFFKRAKFILDQEGVEYEAAVVVEVVKKHLPDWRRIVNELQRHSASGKVDLGALVALQEGVYTELFEALKKKDYPAIRAWVALNVDGDTHHIFRTLYDILVPKIHPNTVPALVLALAKYQYQAEFVADQEINMAACFAEVMIDVEFL